MSEGSRKQSPNRLAEMFMRDYRDLSKDLYLTREGYRAY